VAITSFQSSHPLGVELNKLRPPARDIRLLKNRLHRAFRHTGIAIDAFIGINIELHIVLVKAVARADHYAIGVLAIMARFTNDISHFLCSFPAGRHLMKFTLLYASRVPQYPSIPLLV
jgi:hypothetical protein